MLYRNVMLVHGEAQKMEFLKEKIKQEHGIDCYMPANGKLLKLWSQIYSSKAKVQFRRDSKDPNPVCNIRDSLYEADEGGG